MNHKGLVTFDRKIKKDSFYLYKAYWTKEPFVHICGSRYADRAEKQTQIKVYSNAPCVELYANGKKVGEQTADKVFTFRIPLEGEVKLEAAAVTGSTKYTDTAVIRRVAKPNSSYKLKKNDGKGENWV